jgi:8-oxo-dGTP diphosphatase
VSAVVVVAGLVERDGRVLIGQRRPDGRHALKWEFPGGKVEPGEEPRAALARELREELGIEAEIGEEALRYEYRYPGGPPLLLIFFRVTEFQGAVENLDFTDLRWEEPCCLGQYDFLAGDAGFVRWLQAGRGLG